MKCILLFSCLLLIVGCEAGDFNKLKPPLRNLTIKNTGVVTEKAAIYWPTDSCIGLPDRTVNASINSINILDLLI